MPLLRKDFKAGGFHVANDQPFLDERLSWEARGVLGYLSTKPDDWTPRMYDLVQNGPCKKYKIKRIFEELEEYGYMERRKVRKDDGTFTWEVIVSDHPRFDPGWSPPTPENGHGGQDPAYNKTDSQPDGQTTKTESEQRAREGSDSTSEEQPDVDGDAEEDETLFDQIVNVYRDVHGGITQREEQKLMRLFKQVNGEYESSTIVAALREDLAGTSRWSPGVFMDSVLPKYARDGETGSAQQSSMHSMRNFSEEIANGTL